MMVMSAWSCSSSSDSESTFWKSAYETNPDPSASTAENLRRAADVCKADRDCRKPAFEIRLLASREGCLELLEDVLNVGHRVQVGFLLHELQCVLVCLEQHELVVVELHPRSHEKVTLQVPHPIRLLEARALEKLAAHNARVACRGLKDANGIIGEVVLDDEDAVLVLDAVRLEACHEAEDFLVILHHAVPILLWHLGREVDEAAQRVLLRARVARVVRRDGHLWPHHGVLKVDGDVLELEAVDALVVVTCVGVAAVDEERNAVDQDLLPHGQVRLRVVA
mmetsp:Transcript_13093/g.34929  ORF Transcript_13093/g.34929 Transcript_13093/m.34929 type:complete len:280 (+) Transcript_13093:440-1279(+)